MARQFTPKGFVGALRRWEQKLPAAITEGLIDGNLAALKISVTEYFVGSPEPPGRSAIVNPPNPPPGPLKIRSGDLRRGIQIIDPAPAGKGRWITGLETVGVVYGAIHEFGGRAGRGSFIPARPYLQPALEKADDAGLYNRSIDVHVDDLTNGIFG